MSKRILKIVAAAFIGSVGILTLLWFWDRRSESLATIHFSATTNNGRYVFHYRQAGSNWTEDGGALPIPLPYEYTDTNSGIILHVEKDGRHIRAVGPEGRALWSSDPFADAHLELYRTHTPCIVYIGEPSQASRDYWSQKGKKVVGLGFNSSQFGVIDVTTGEFMFEGQD